MIQENNIYQLKVFYNTIPPVWRRIQIPKSHTIWDLLVTIQDSVNLLDCRFHQFNISDLIEDNEEDNVILKKELALLRNLDRKIFEVHQKGEDAIDNLLNIISSKQYAVHVEKRVPPEQYISYPICIDGKNSFYPNQNPKILDFEELIKSLLTTNKGNNKKILQWVGKNFRFDVNVTPRIRIINKTISIYSDNKDNISINFSVWLLKIIQGGFDPDKLAEEFSLLLPKKDVIELYDTILKEPLKQRKQALCILSLLKGIPKKLIELHLNISRDTIYEFIRRYQIGGVKRLLNRKTISQKKYETPLYIKEVFSILHSPPSLHGFNRTTWIIDDIKRVMEKKNLSINRRYISKIIRNAGYKITKTRLRLTSNDPDYREKLDNIKNILSKLGPKEKFFSIDEYGPFTIRIYGGRSLVPPGEVKTIPQWQKSKGSLIITAALELSTNQVTHFYSEKKNTDEMIKLLDILIEKYSKELCIYFSWDAASWHASKKLYRKVDEINSKKFKEKI